MNRRFTTVPDNAQDALIGEMPLCWIVPHRVPEAAILMPVICEREGADLSLLGHLPRAAQATAILAQDPMASFLFLGPNAYISPDMAGRRDWAPTWNFASARLSGPVTLDENLTRTSVEKLVAHMEGAAGWRIEELGSRAGGLLVRVIGFRATIDSAAPRLKLGQDESPETFDAIVTALEGTDLGRWMAQWGRH